MNTDKTTTKIGKYLAIIFITACVTTFIVTVGYFILSVYILPSSQGPIFTIFMPPIGFIAGLILGVIWVIIAVIKDRIKNN